MGSLEYGQGFQALGASCVNTALPGIISTLTPYWYGTYTNLKFDTFIDDSYQARFGLKEEAQWQAGEWLGMKHEAGLGGEAEASGQDFYGFFPRVTATGSVSFGS